MPDRADTERIGKEFHPGPAKLLKVAVGLKQTFPKAKACGPSFTGPQDVARTHQLSNTDQSC